MYQLHLIENNFQDSVYLEQYQRALQDEKLHQLEKMIFPNHILHKYRILKFEFYLQYGLNFLFYLYYIYLKLYLHGRYLAIYQLNDCL